MAAQVSELPPRGYYLAHEVGRLVGVSGDRIGQWARRGYIRPSVEKGPPNVYAYQDVAEAMVVRELVERDVPFRTIKKAIEVARQTNGSGWPLTNAVLYVGAGGVVALESEEQYRADVRNRQGLLEDVIPLERVRSLLASGGWAARDLPDLRYIEVNPDRMSGQPVVRGTRVPAEDAGRLAVTPGGRGRLIEDYGLTEEQIDDAARWWAAVARYEVEAA